MPGDTGMAVKASLLAVSVLGGEGTTTDQPAERYLRDATPFQFAQGSPQVQRLARLGMQVLGLEGQLGPDSEWAPL